MARCWQRKQDASPSPCEFCQFSRKTLGSMEGGIFRSSPNFVIILRVESQNPKALLVAFKVKKKKAFIYYFA